MPRSVIYVFTTASPWAYLGFDAFQDVVARHGLSVVYRPTPFGAVFEESGGLPLARRHPLRQRYRLVELQRWRERRGLTLVLQPRGVPFDPALADKCVLALTAAGVDPAPYLRRAHAAVWAEERSLGSPSVIAEVLAEAGVSDPDGVLEAARSEEIAAVYGTNVQAALEDGVFGAPSYVVDGEVFWGQDRIELLDAMLTSGRPAFTPG